MKLWNLATFLTVSILIFSGCNGLSPTPKDKVIIDNTLPVITLTPNGVFSDMQALGFEWDSVTDPRVKGIYVYKKAALEEQAEHAYYDSIKNRFVTHYIDEDVEPQTQYSYIFKTFSKDAESQPSLATTAGTLPILDSVSWIHVVQNMPRSAKIIWRPHSNEIVKSYIVERKTLEEDDWDELTTIDGRLNAEYIDDELKNDYVYKYRIRVLTYTDIISNPSATVKVVTKALPKQVQGILATKNLPKKIKLVWEKATASDFMHYNIYKADEIDGSYEFVISTKNNEYIDEIPEDGIDAFYRISMVDTDELESKNDVSSVHGKTLAKPTTPSLVEVMMVNNNLEISWSSSDPRVKSFMVNKKTKKSWIDTSDEEFVDIKGKTFVDTAVEPETTYYYTVSSVDEFSIPSEPSIEVMFTTSKEQGKNIQANQEPIEEPVSVKTETNQVIDENNQNVVQPMDDFDISEI